MRRRPGPDRGAGRSPRTDRGSWRRPISPSAATTGCWARRRPGSLAPSQATDRDEEVDAVNTDGSKYMDTGRPCGAREEAAELSAHAREGSRRCAGSRWQHRCARVNIRARRRQIASRENWQATLANCWRTIFACFAKF